MVKNSNEIDFITNKNFSGEFILPGDIKVQGKLKYEKNQKFSLKLFSDKPLETLSFPDMEEYGNEIKISSIYGQVFDENDSTWYISLKNCSAYNVIISQVYQYDVYFAYIVFSKSRVFNFESDKNLKVDLHFNIWDEFCHPQGFKRDATYVPIELDIKLKNGLNITFEQEAWTTFLDKENAFDSLFIAQSGTDKSIKDEINQKLKEVLVPYGHKVNVKLPEKHEWYISLNNFSKVEQLREICWYLELLIICLTNDFAASIEKIKIHTKFTIQEPNISFQKGNFFYR